MPQNALTDLEARVAGLVDRDGLVDAVRRLVRIPSWGGDETPAQEAVAELAGAAGLAVETWAVDLDAVRGHPECSYEIERDAALGVTATLAGAGTGRTLVLNGHVDVVPPGDEALWSHPPFAGALEDGRIHGRGALDMKGPLAAGLFAMRAIRDAGVRLAGSVRLESVVGEEDGGIGTLAAILRDPSGDGAIVMEPTGLAVAPLQAGCLNFRVRVRGRAAHGAVRTEGVSAFDKLFAIYGSIEALERRRNREPAPDPLFARYPTPFPISVGTISGGDWASSVPDHVAIEGRLGVRPDEDPRRARRELEEAVADAAGRDPWLRAHPPVVEWWGGRFLPADTPAGDPLVGTLRAAASAVLGADAPLEGVPFGADAGLYSRVARIPTVLFGAGDIRIAHRPDEHVVVDDLVAMARALAVAALRYCGPAPARDAATAPLT